MHLLITNIHQLLNVREQNQLLRGKAMADLPMIENAFLVIHKGRIEAYGSMDALPEKTYDAVYDAGGATVLPTWCDSHTHLVFAISRDQEFVDKLNGLSYADIAAKGGGILNSAAALHTTPESVLYESAILRLQELIHLGTGAIEIKSGYGLTVADELKMLRVIQRLKAAVNIPVKATFLGAHAIPAAYRENKQGYIQLIIQEMLPKIADEQLADYMDVFCEQNFFSVADTEIILEAAYKFGLPAKLHANQLAVSGGVEVGVKHKAISVDHLEAMNEKSIHALATSNTIGTILPTAAFFLRMQYAPVRKMLQKNCALALASDYNPGSSPSGNMNFVVSLACIQNEFLPEEAINAATINGAFAMGIEKEVGSITIGKKANLIFTKPIPSVAYLPYHFGMHLIDKVMIEGNWI
ncbi:MAG: imidazolonepropionase [Sphingobacteriales bacterium]|uniref:imidazolonepropionase n=1 Tax=Hydrotalea flava TaxID=714549 RepID=UPI00082C5EC0|nr:imidazolonepropionase [Hydrotalea flava]RTL53409.1 MAG: imidazolonepropionase [Sphingobacteriales bacterium]